MRLWIVSCATTYRRNFTDNIVSSYAFKSEDAMREFVARDFKAKLTWMMNLATGEEVVYASAKLKEVEKDAMCSAIIVTRDAKGEETQISWDVTPTLIDATFSTGVKDNELREDCK